MAKRKRVKKVAKKVREVCAPKLNACNLYDEGHQWRETWNPDMSKSKACDCGAVESI